MEKTNKQTKNKRTNNKTKEQTKNKQTKTPALQKGEKHLNLRFNKF